MTHCAITRIARWTGRASIAGDPCEARWTGRLLSNYSRACDEMAWFTMYSNVDTGDEVMAYNYTTICYCDENGNEYDTPQKPAYCRNCHSIVNSEAYATHLAQQRERIQTALADPNSLWAWSFQDAENANATIRELDALAAFLHGRKAGPRCLECFSEDIMEIPNEEDREFECPDGNRYTRKGFGHASMWVEIAWRLSREGLPI